MDIKLVFKKYPYGICFTNPKLFLINANLINTDC